jgi:Plasmid pRiA4b ORF-3-like protein
MPAKNSAITAEIYQLKVTLLGTNPPIWRRLLAPANLTLAQMHDVLQVAMG